MLSFFPPDVLYEILTLIESVSEGFPTYSNLSRYSTQLLPFQLDLPLDGFGAVCHYFDVVFFGTGLCLIP